RRVNGKPILYFDNAATTQKPWQTIHAILVLYSSGTSNVHRAVNFLADEVTEAFESGRRTVARFIGAQAREIIFTINAPQGINLVCSALACGSRIRVVTTTLEHHSNLLPWIKNGQVEFVPWKNDGVIDLDALSARLTTKPDLVTIAQTSNFLG